MKLSPRQQRERDHFNEHPETFENWKEYSYEQWRTWRPIQQRALDFLGSMAGKRLLLCGIGSEAIVFARAGAEVWGFDIADRQVESVEKLVARHDLRHRIHLAVSPFEQLDFPDNFFDAAHGIAI